MKTFDCNLRIDHNTMIKPNDYSGILAKTPVIGNSTGNLRESE